MRSDLRTFRDFVDGQWANDLRVELQWLGSELGEVRDIEVMLERLRADAAALPDTERDAGDRVIRRLIADWHAARTHMIEHLAGPRFAALREPLEAAAARPRCTPWAHLRATQALPPVVLHLWRKLRSAVDDLGPTPPDEALHAVRIRAKRARYAAEATIPVFGKPARKYARAIAEVQEALGEHQDAVVARTWLAKTASECSPNEAFAAGMLAERESDAANAARDRFPGTWEAARIPKLREWL
jgi:CHAD domain-containing protein